MNGIMLIMGLVFVLAPFLRVRRTKMPAATRSQLARTFAWHYLTAFFALVLASDLLPLVVGQPEFARALGAAAYWLAACSAVGETGRRHVGGGLTPAAGARARRP